MVRLSRIYIKTVVLIVLLSSASFSQIGNFAFWGEDYEADAQTYFNAMATPLSAGQKTKINTLVKMLKDSLAITSLSSAFDVFYVFANETQEAGLRNLVKRSHDATAVNTPAFTQWQGFTGAATKYLDANYNASTQGITYQTNSASLGAYCRTDISETGDLIGFRNATIASQIIIATSNRYFVQVNDSTPTAYTGATDSRGMWINSRIASSTATGYRNGTPIYSNNKIGTSVPNYNMYVLARNNAGTLDNETTRQVAVAFAGKGFTDVQARAVTNCIEFYMDSIGTGVIP